ncbi:hypothetical protein DMH04_41985 [Kibdelosporangium aridum]|uniref:Uncharacterized protein n=1 Tax=Kibdelosporangium aridum TaxID=2030 RepID=A0A428YTK4_KIBAR|nr:hypothetical protein [Kibdelosporangium aridum]RSM72799.1 hypothetical protein DMH04_41985 [Kibdelosporangium aridum]
MTQPTHWPVARLRLMGSGLWILAGALAVLGSFLPLVEHSVRQAPTSTRGEELRVTLWGLTTTSSANDPFPQFGIPVVIAAVLLAAAAVLGLTSTRLHPASGPVLAARLIGTAGTGLLIGAIAQPLALFRVFSDESFLGPFFEPDAPGLGTWLLLVSCLLGITAIVLMLVPKIAKRGEEPETPPMGIPVVRVLEPEYDEPADERSEAAQPTDPKG